MTCLVNVRLETSSLEETADAYRVICGIEPEADPVGGSGVRLRLEGATLTLAPATNGGSGITSITLAVRSLQIRRRALEEAGVFFENRGAGLSIAAHAANGLAVEIIEKSDVPPVMSSPGARLDHVALRVGDLTHASARWQAITGIEARQMGLHPISGGSFSAARILLGERMIELISPVHGVASPIAARLRSHGEGVAALALPVTDIGTVRDRLTDMGVRVLRREPHWMVHPGDAGGVLVQLTPRVEHE